MVVWEWILDRSTILLVQFCVRYEEAVLASSGANSKLMWRRSTPNFNPISGLCLWNVIRVFEKGREAEFSTRQSRNRDSCCSTVLYYWLLCGIHIQHTTRTLNRPSPGRARMWEYCRREWQRYFPVSPSKSTNLIIALSGKLTNERSSATSRSHTKIQKYKNKYKEHHCTKRLFCGVYYPLVPTKAPRMKLQ